MFHYLFLKFTEDGPLRPTLKSLLCGVCVWIDECVALYREISRTWQHLWELPL